MSERSKPNDANQYLAAGAGFGIYGAISVAIGAAVCPICVIAAPTLLGVGAYKKWRAGRESGPSGET